MRDQSPQSPEARRKRHASLRAAFGADAEKKLEPRLTALEVIKRVAVGVYNDGFIHAGNLAYLAIVALFPFFIVAAAVAHIFGQSQDAQLTVFNILRRLPPEVSTTLAEPINEVLNVRTGPLLWLGALVGLWTATSFVETIRDILRRAYGVKFCAPFWEYRAGSILLILGAVILLMLAFTASAALSLVQAAVSAWLPFASGLGQTLGIYRLIPGVTLFVTFYLLFFALTPKRYRKRDYRKWPGALCVTTWWLATVQILPMILGLLGGYSLTYGSLAGVMITLLFFFVVGLGVVIGAELNAALAESGSAALKGEIYTGPYTDQLEVVEPQPGEDVPVEVQTKGQLV
ncbi:MAG: YihY/virulence factor BrkB family protein [Sphingomicrobium sp.]